MQAMYEMFYVDSLIDVALATSIALAPLVLLSLLFWMIDWSSGITSSSRTGDPDEF